MFPCGVCPLTAVSPSAPTSNCRCVSGGPWLTVKWGNTQSPPSIVVLVSKQAYTSHKAVAWYVVSAGIRIAVVWMLSIHSLLSFIQSIRSVPKWTCTFLSSEVFHVPFLDQTNSYSSLKTHLRQPLFCLVVKSVHSRYIDTFSSASHLLCVLGQFSSFSVHQSFFQRMEWW